MSAFNERGALHCRTGREVIPATICHAEIAQLGERQTEDLKVPGSIPGRGIWCFIFFVSENACKRL